MSASLFIIVASLVALGVTLLLALRSLWTLRTQPEDRSAWLGLAVAALGAGITLWAFSSHLGPSQPHSDATATDWPPPAVAGGVSYVELSRNPLQGPVRPWLSLNVAGLDLEQMARRTETSGGWLLLDGAQGIRPEYRGWIEARFGKLQALPQAGEQLTCFRRTDFFPLASGRCVSRPARQVLAPDANDLARTTDGRALVSVRRTGSALIVLTLEEIPRAASIEEGCLQSLGRGSSCAALDVLPGATLSTLAVKPAENTQLRVYREFGIPTPKELDEALSIYAEPSASRLEITEEQETRDSAPDVCGGLRPPKTLKLRKLSGISEALREARSESEISKALDRFKALGECPGVAELEIPPLQMRNEVSALRSILTQIRERPLWITLPESFKIRFDKIDRTQLAWRTLDGALWVKPDSRIENLAVTILSNRPISDNDLTFASAAEPAAEFTVYRLTPSAFRVSFRELRQAAGIRLNERIWARAPEPASVFLDWSGFAGASLAAFILAGMTSLFQSVSLSRSRARAFFTGTFSAVFLISFVWVFLSYRAALAPMGMSISEAGLERPPAPAHFFLREWPDLPQTPLLSLPQAGDAWKRWEQYLTLARNELKGVLAQRPGKVQVVSSARIPRTVIPGSAKVVLWDDARARNFHFRKNPEYQAWITGWEALLKKRKDPYVLENGGSADQALRRSPQILLIPDAQFLEENDHKRLQAWVETGGTLLASDGPFPGSHPASTAASWLESSGFGSGVARNYSRVLLPGGRALDLGVPHRAVASIGGGEPRFFGASAQGKGRVFYLGLAPLNQVSQELLITWMAGLAGERVSVPDSGRPCIGTLLLEPWGAPPEVLRSFAFSLRSRRIPFQWLIDPVSFARMMPQWQEEFRRDGVVFRDDGTRATRELGALLARYGGWADPAALVFATGRPLASNLTGDAGPEGATLMRFVSFPGNDNPVHALEFWKADCQTGVSEARLLDSAWIERGANAQELESLTGFTRDQFTPLPEVLRLQQALYSGQKAGVRILETDPLDPLRTRDQGKPQ